MKGTRSNWEQVLLVCARCSRRLDGGFGPKGRTPLAKALRRELGVSRGRKARAGVVEVKCLGVCPRGGVVVVDAAHPQRWSVVPAGAELADLFGTRVRPQDPDPAVDSAVAEVSVPG
jgi:predicted metal-binding protein